MFLDLENVEEGIKMAFSWRQDKKDCIRKMKERATTLAKVGMLKEADKLKFKIKRLLEE